MVNNALGPRFMRTLFAIKHIQQHDQGVPNKIKEQNMSI